MTRNRIFAARGALGCLAMIGAAFLHSLALATYPEPYPTPYPATYPGTYPGGGGVGFKWTTAPTNQTVAEGALLSFSVAASGTGVVYSIGANDSGAVNASTGAYTWTPSYASAGTYTVTFTATAGTRTLSKAVTITVTNTVSIAWVHTPADTTGEQRTTISTSYNAAVLEGTAAYAATGLPTGATYNDGTGAFAWTPDSTQYGPIAITFIATVNGDTISQAATFTISKIYNVLSFDGADTLTIANLAFLDANGSTTVEFWAMDSLVSATNQVRIFQRSEYTGNFNGLAIHARYSDSTTTVMTVHNEDTGTLGAAAWTTSPYRRSWHHYAFVFDSTNATTNQRLALYVDGVFVAKHDSNAVKTTIGTVSPTTAFIGGTKASGVFFIGRLANFRIWDAALSGAQIAAVKDSVNIGPGFSAALKMELNYANGTVWYDNSGNGNHFAGRAGATMPTIRTKSTALPTPGNGNPY